jgi:integrase
LPSHSAAFAACVGVRFLGVQWGDVDLEHMSIAVRCAVEQAKPNEDQPTHIRFKKTKSGKERAVAFGTEVAEALRRAKRTQAERFGIQAVASEKLVVTHPNGGLWLPNTFTKDFAALVKSMGIRGYFHMLRHTSATNMVRNGTPIPVAKKQLGHATMSYMIDRYVHIDAGMQGKAAEKLDAWLQEGKRAACRIQSSVSSYHLVTFHAHFVPFRMWSDTKRHQTTRTQREATRS